MDWIRPNRRKAAAAVVQLVLAVWILWPGPAATRSPQVQPQRIVSLIPAVTEMLYAVGAGPQVVAVSSFDHYPPDVEKLPKVGALLDPDLERILSLKPDLVAVYATQTDLRTQLARASIPLYVYSHGALADVTTTLRAVGLRAGHGNDAAALATQIEGRIDYLRGQLARANKPRTLTVFGREPFALRGIFASGGRGFIHDMVTAAGGANVFAGVDRESVQTTSEAVLARRPEAILELRGNPLTAPDLARETSVWKALASVPAVRTGRVFIIADERTVTPGPRVADGIEVIARALHPAIFK
jgi:iron complex transport system substrate-binding protein